MKIVIEILKNHTGIHYAIIFMVTLIMAVPAIDWQVTETHDGHVHILRLIGTNIALANTDFPHLVIPYFCNDFGYSMNLFYGILVTYPPLLLKAFPISYVGALKIFAVATIFFSGIAMYRCILEITKKKEISLVASLLYMTAVYRFEDIYTRFAMGEFAAFVFLPMILQALHNILNEDGKKAWLLGLGVTALVLTHSITTVYFAIFCLIYVLLHGKKLWRKQVWGKFIAQIGIVLVLTAFYTIPMFEHKMATEYCIFTPKVMKTHGAWAAKHTVEPLKFLNDKQYPLEGNDIRMEIGIPMLTLLVLGIFVRKKIPANIKDIWVISLMLSAVSLFMCTEYFPWRYLPDFLCTIQYPWRMNTFFILFASIACSINLYYFVSMWKKDWIKNIISGIAIAGILANTVYYTSFYQWEDTTLDKQYEERRLHNLTFSHMAINRDYLPLRALILQDSYLKEREDRVYVLKGDATITNEEKEGLHLEFTLQNGTRGTILELPYFYYLGYQVTVQTEQAEYKIQTNESKNGFVQVILPEDIDEAKVIVHYTGTALEKASYGISAVGCILIAGYAIMKRSKQENAQKLERKNN